jgi:hypothetical protein
MRRLGLKSKIGRTTYSFFVSAQDSPFLYRANIKYSHRLVTKSTGEQVPRSESAYMSYSKYFKGKK